MMIISKKRKKSYSNAEFKCKQRKKIDLMDDDILLDDEKCQVLFNSSLKDRFNFSSIRFDDIIARFSGHQKLTIIMNSKWFTGNHCCTGSIVIYYDLCIL